MTRPLNAATRAKLKKDFDAIPERMRAKAAEVCLESASEMVRQMKAALPEVEGKLKRSVRVEDESTESWIRYRVRVGGPLTTERIGNRSYDREVRVGSGDTAGRKKTKGGKGVTYDYANAYEFGTSDQPPQPFYRPTRDRVAKKHRAKMRNALKKAAQAD